MQGSDLSERNQFIFILMVLASVEAMAATMIPGIGHSRSTLCHDLVCSTSYTADIAYKKELPLDDYERERCNLDLYLPEKREKFPTIIRFYGGSLQRGKKDDGHQGRTRHSQCHDYPNNRCRRFLLSCPPGFSSRQPQPLDDDHETTGTERPTGSQNSRFRSWKNNRWKR